MRSRPLFVAAAVTVVASCADQPVPSGPQQTKPSLASYITSVVGPVVLGSVGGSTYNIAWGINDLGDIVGVSGDAHSAVRWPTGTGVMPSSISPLIVSPTGAGGRDANVAGQIAGEFQATNTPLHAALWTPTGGGGYILTDIGLQLAASYGASESVAFGINAGGSVVGNYTAHAPSGQLVSRCFLWTPTSTNGTTGTVITLPDFGGGFCVANDINNAGLVAGASTLPAVAPAPPVHHAFVWDGTTLTDLTPLGGYSYGAAISDAGEVAGSRIPPAGVLNAAVWTSTGPGTWSVLDLIAPPLSGQSGTVTSQALDINDAGFVVGMTHDAAAQVIRAFFWNGSFVELPDPAAYPITQANALTNLVGNLVVVAGIDSPEWGTSKYRALRWAVAMTEIELLGCIADLYGFVNDLAEGGVLNAGEARALVGRLDAAARQISQKRMTPAANLLHAFINDVNALARSGRLMSEEQVRTLTDNALCVIAAL